VSRAEERTGIRVDKSPLRIAMVVEHVDHNVAAMLTVVGAIARGRWGCCAASGEAGAVSFESRTALLSAQGRCRCGHELLEQGPRAIVGSLLVRDHRLGLGGRGYISRTRRWLGVEDEVTVLVQASITDTDVMTWFAAHDVHLAAPAADHVPPSVILASQAVVPSILPSPDLTSSVPWIRMAPVRMDLRSDGSRRMHIEIGPTAAAVVAHAGDVAIHAALDADIRS